MKRISILIFLVSALASLKASAQQTDKEAITIALENYMSGQRDRATKAFHPNASMKYIHFQTGEYKEVPIADYLSKLSNTPALPNAPDAWKRSIESIDIQGPAAQAKIVNDAGTMMIYDYMTLLKVNGEWKIVSKVFSRIDK